jgi:hypothetical protein
MYVLYVHTYIWSILCTAGSRLSSKEKKEKEEKREAARPLGVHGFAGLGGMRNGVCVLCIYI